VANLKKCFEFVQEEHHQILRHIPNRWFALFQATDRLLLSWQSKNLRESEAQNFRSEPVEVCKKCYWRIPYH